MQEREEDARRPETGAQSESGRNRAAVRKLGSKNENYTAEKMKHVHNESVKQHQV